MLFTRGALSPATTVLVQGAGGGVATALIVLGAAAGLRVWVDQPLTRPSAPLALELGAHEAFESGARLPDRVDAVIETVGEATWSHSIRSLRPGGRIVVAGATTRRRAAAELTRIFFLQLQVIGSTMGTRDELERLIALLDANGHSPARSTRRVPLADARRRLRRDARRRAVRASS